VTDAAPARFGDIPSDQVLELAIRNLEKSRHLDVVDLESHGDHVIVEAVIPEPDRHGMQRRQLPDSRRSIHNYEGKYEQVRGHP
jgi:hypothetical protein